MEAEGQPSFPARAAQSSTTTSDLVSPVKWISKKIIIIVKIQFCYVQFITSCKFELLSVTGL